MKSGVVKKALYTVSGIMSIVLAYAGIIIPGFPAVPFIILAAYFFTNSSPRLYAWMMRQRLIKKLFDKSNKIDRRIFKALLISQIWFSVAVVEFTLARNTNAKIVVAAGGVLLTLLVIVFMKTKRNSHSNNSAGNGR